MTYQREITSNERLYNAAETLCPPFVINMVVEGEGTLSLEALRAAVERASEACKGARLVARAGRWVDTGRAPPVRTGSVDKELRARLDPEKGPTCEVVLDGSRVLFRAFHGVMDGKGALLWIHDVFRVLRGEEPLGAPSTETDQGLLARLDTRQARKFEFDCPSPFGSAKVDSYDFLWKRRTLPGSHAALVARAAAVLCEERALRIMVPVDLRRHAPELRSTSNLSMPIFLDARAGEPWEELQERLLTALAARAELTHNDMDSVSGLMPGFGLKAMVRMACTVQRAKGKYLLASAVVSHVGKVELAALSTPTFRARTLYSLPVHAPLVPLVLVAVDLGSHVELCLSCPEGAGMSARADALLDRIVAALDTQSWSKNLTDHPFPDRTVVDLFTAQVARTPDAVALVEGEKRQTYRELDARADDVARALMARGVGEGHVVGVLHDRTLEAMAALLGTLKSGAAYLPLDPRYPDERLRFMLADAGAGVCLTEASYLSRVQRLFAGQALQTADIPAGSLPVSAPRNTRALAYVIYTSGSTGKPKGVQIEHRALVNYVHWAIEAYGVDARTRFALFTSLAFDLSITSLFVPLLGGGSVALFPEELDHLTLQRLLAESGVDSLKLTPTHLDLLSRLDASPRGFRVLVVGGEQLHGQVAERAQRMFGPACRIVNEYGPTETTVGCIVHTFRPEDAQEQAVPIGAPIYNTRIELLDEHRAKVSQGETGEIYILGEGLARGYLGRDELDRERFVMLPEGRAYRTGDLARIRDDGLMEFLGRSDDQIKIRGHRIEPGEVEAALREHPEVEHALVLGRKPPSGGGQLLCAYVVSTASEDTLRSHLEARLPSALVPTFIGVVERIPLTVNGKVDVKSLPDPFTGERASVRHAPQTELERAIHGLWAELLGVPVDTLGPDADFHRLGGDSLTMVQMLARVAKLVRGDEQRFMQSIKPILRKPTLSSVCQAAIVAQRAAQGIAHGVAP